MVVLDYVRSATVESLMFSFRKFKEPFRGSRFRAKKEELERMVLSSAILLGFADSTNMAGK